jgi:hypothetical protein
MNRNNTRTLAAVAARETVESGRPRKKRVHLTISLPDQHFRDAIKAEAAVRHMSVNSLIRAMIRGYFSVA